jgi:hypothetical protein
VDRVSADDLLRLVDESGLIFAGAVVASEAPEADAAPETAPQTFMVKVGEVLRATDVLRRLAGGAVTVVSEQGPPDEVDTRWVFFTECISLADSVVARELGRREGTPDSVRAIVEAVREIEERPLAARVAGAQLVVTGHVTESSLREPELPPSSEHDPLWAIARIAIDSVLKGRTTRKTVDVLFASSKDIAWYASPKLGEGAHGILLLRRPDEMDALEKVPANAFEAVDPLDFLPLDRLADVERLIEHGAGGPVG